MASTATNLDLLPSEVRAAREVRAVRAVREVREVREVWVEGASRQTGVMQVAGWQRAGGWYFHIPRHGTF